MATYAVIKDETVVNVIVADSQEVAEQCNPGNTCVEYTQENPAVVGGTWNGSTFSEPVPE
jgi:hypothetical protein